MMAVLHETLLGQFFAIRNHYQSFSLIIYSQETGITFFKGRVFKDSAAVFSSNQIYLASLSQLYQEENRSSSLNFPQFCENTRLIFLCHKQSAGFVEKFELESESECKGSVLSSTLTFVERILFPLGFQTMMTWLRFAIL